jgi:hypothetical protein
MLSLLFIDFGDGCVFDESAKPLKYDARYPFFRHICPSARATNFFLFNVEQFIKQRVEKSFSQLHAGKWGCLFTIIIFCQTNPTQEYM